MSRATLARVRRPSGSTSCPGQLGPGSESPRGQAALPGDSRFGLRARGVEQLSQATRAWVCGPKCSTSPSGQIAPCSDGPQCQQALRVESGPCPRARSVDQLCQATQVCVRGPAVYLLSWATWEFARCSAGSNSCPGNSGPGPRARGADQLSRGIQPMPEGQPHPPVVPGDWDPCLKARLFDQLSLANHAWVRVPAGLTGSPGQHALLSRAP